MTISQVLNFGRGDGKGGKENWERRGKESGLEKNECGPREGIGGK